MRSAHSSRVPGFNPCFRGSSSGRETVEAKKKYKVVSILVFVEVALEVVSARHPAEPVIVSILVFVEVALEVFMIPQLTPFRGFQSLFSWK